jgi:hypothetical protein
MSATVKDKIEVLRHAAAQLKLSKGAVARRYGCSHQFVYEALKTGRAPEALLCLIEKMISERRRELRRALEATSGKRRAS